jgi:hypothetical protein
MKTMNRTNKGTFAPGNKAAVGRGKKQQTSQQLRETFERLVLTNAEKLEADFAKVSPVDRLNFISKLAPYFLPRLQAIELTAPPTDLETLMSLTPEQRQSRIIELQSKIQNDKSA